MTVYFIIGEMLRPLSCLIKIMNFERWLISVIAGIFLALMALTISSKKPLCIDSKIVDKIDRITATSVETVYRCSLTQPTAYSRYFDENKDQFESRIESIALFLRAIDPYKKNLQIRINELQPILFKISDHQIEIGSQLFNSSLHFERALVKVWLQERVKKDPDSQRLFIEVAADFLMYAANGSLEIEDPILKVKTKIGGARWPQVLKSRDGYCESPWKASEHYADCAQIKNSENLNSDLLLSLSLRPLMTSVWVKAYAELNYKEKSRFISLLPRYLQTQQLSSEKAIRMVMTDTHPLKQGMMNIKKMTDLMNSSSLIQNEKEYREFYSRVALNLQQSGVSDSFAEAYFDFLFEYPDHISTNSPLFKNLEKAAYQFPQLQIAIKDKEQIWILPGTSGLPLHSFDQIRTQQHIFLACLGLKEIEMQQFFNHAEKLLLIKGCDQNKNTDYNALISQGIQNFSRKNKHLAFIQFHLPSFESKAKELLHIKNFFDLVQSRDVSKPEFQTLGWRNIEWYEDSQAYKPQAVVDAIELFRTETN
ncbi:MAG: hypothetical protein H7061_12545 [Bdellovibrionaceae bacterium]|nr:hypothetical protein [Bdellovibrio sp.]